MIQAKETIVWHEHDCGCRVCQPPRITTFAPAYGVQWFKALPGVVTHMRREKPEAHRTGDEPV